jgi:uncharacterized membrane protein YhiD involved in acid resistance
MKELSELFDFSAFNAGGPDLESALLALLVAFVLGQFIAWVYLLTHSGLSYSQSFSQALVLLTTIVCLVMMVIGSNVLTAFGLFGALAIIRFRNVLKDTRDTAFIFFALVLGIGTGSGRHLLAALGALVVSAIMIYLHATRFGARNRFDSYLRFLLDESGGNLAHLRPILRRYARSFRLVARRVMPGEVVGEVSYRLTLRDPVRAGEMVEELKAAPGVTEVSLVVQEDQAEV